MPFTPKVASPSSKEITHATQLSFHQGVRAITEIFEKTPPQESIQSKIEKFVEKNLPDLPIAHAVALCYRIAAVEVPRTKGFELPPLSIEETVPTQDPVCLPTIMAEVKTYISKYVVSPPEVINLLAYYAASTWFCRLLSVVPYLFITSGAPGSGKSTMAQAVAHICYRSCMVSSASSTAALSRICSQRPCTVMIDELDSAPVTFLQEVTAILNAGSSSDIRRLIVERSSSGRHQIAALSTFGPKILVGLQGPTRLRSLQPATVSRCITVTTLGAKGVQREKIPAFENDEEAADLRKNLAAIADSHGVVFAQTMRHLQSLDALPPRTKDKYLPLMALAKMVDVASASTSNSDLLWTYLRSAEVQEADIGKYILDQCGKILNGLIAGALKSLRLTDPPKVIQGLRLVPSGELKPHIACALLHETVVIFGTPSGKSLVSKMEVFVSKGHKYVRASSLLAILLLDSSSSLQTINFGKPMSYPDFCQHLKSYGYELTRTSASRGLIELKSFCTVLSQWLDNFCPDPIFL